MATNVTFNGSNYSVPSTGNDLWGANVSNYLIAIATGCLQKTGGTFTLTAEADFGANHGLKSLYFASRSTPATAEAVRLGNDQNIAWRNAANNANITFGIDGSDEWDFNGTALSTTELGYLAGVTSSIQTQLNAKLESVDLTSDVTGDLPVADGGTGSSTAAGARTNLGLVIGTDVQAYDADLAALAALDATAGLLVKTAANTYARRTVTAGSTKLTVTNGDGASDNPTLDVSEANLDLANIGGSLDVTSQITGAVPVANGGTGSTTASAARTALGLAIGTDVQAYDADLAALAALDATAGLIVKTAANTYARRTISDAGSSRITVTNGNGVLGNPTLDVSESDLDLANIGGSLGLTSQVTGALPIANGGTGQTTATAAINALLPSQTGNSGNVLTTNGTNVSWAAALTSTLTNSYIFVGDGSNQAQGVAVSGDITLANDGTTAIASGVIVNADVSASAAIAFSKLAPLTSGNILVGNGSNVAASVAMSGDVTIANDGTTSIGSGVIVNADVNASAAIAYSKLNLSGSIVNADISGSAAIADSKLNTISTAGKVSGSAITSGTVGGSTAINTSGAITTTAKITAGSHDITNGTQTGRVTVGGVASVPDTGSTRTIMSGDPVGVIVVYGINSGAGKIFTDLLFRYAGGVTTIHSSDNGAGGIGARTYTNSTTNLNINLAASGGSAFDVTTVHYGL